ncbi:MAG: DUF4838 domain-containing protein [Clostridia bacterium]|nr:DUF4838 domain-containing protein [Clostridia bacterium]
MKKINLYGYEAKEYNICVGENAVPNEIFSAKELCKYLGICTCKISTEVIKPCFVIGFGAKGNEALYKSDNEEGFIIKADNGIIRISGGKKRGTMYGVYSFLEDYIGWRFIANDTEYLKDFDVDINSPIEDLQIPKFEWRDVCSCVYEPTDIAAKRKINSSYLRDFSEEQGGSYLYPGRFIHTMESLLGVPQHKQPCFTDEENIKKATENVLALLRENPDARVISVSQNDAHEYEKIWCECDRCRELDEREGSKAASLLYFVNRIAEAVEVEFPRVKIMTLAYLESVKCPKTVRPRKNVIIEFAPLELCYIHSVDDEICRKNREHMADFEAWSEITDKIFIWDYIVNFSFSVPLFPDFHVLLKNMRYYYKHNVKGMFCEGDNAHKPGATSDLAECRAYLLSKLLWKPDMDEEEFNACRDDFLLGYYGKGGLEIGKYIDMMTKIVNIPEHHIHCFNNPTTLVPHMRFVPAIPYLEKFWDKAEAMAETKSEKEHCERSRLQFEYMKLLFTYDELHDILDGEDLEALMSENKALYDNLVKYEVHPRGTHSELPHLHDMTENMGKKIYW